MESRKGDIQGANGVVFGISADSPFSLAKWAEQERFSFPLLSDFGKDIARAYGALHPELAGLKEVPKRSAFLIDKNGLLVRQEISEDPGIIPDLEGFIAHMKALG